MILGRGLLIEDCVSWPDAARPAGTLLLNPTLAPAARNAILSTEFPRLSNHVWIASSGSGGRLKVIALSRIALEASANAVNEHLRTELSDRWLNPLPRFHVGGLGIVVRAFLVGSRCDFLPRWSAEEFVRAARVHGSTLASLVPTQVYDLVVARATCPPALRAVVVGGGALDEDLHVRAAELGWPLLPSYGMTETGSQVATTQPGAEDFVWLPLLDHVEARISEAGLLELRGPSLLTGWMLFASGGSARWENPKHDGWFRTNDRAELQKGKLRFLGRADDLTKIRGELVDVAALESALQARVPSGLVRIDPSPDPRNGIALTVVAENAAAEAEARGADELFPPYARPVAFRVGPVALSPLGKKIRSVTHTCSGGL